MRSSLAALVSAALAAPVSAQAPRPVTNGGLPAVSPDGSLIALWSNRDGPFDEYVIRADGSAVQRLTTGIGQTSAPAWTRDGRVAFSVSAGDTARVFTMEPTGQGLREIGRVVGHNPILLDDRHLVYSAGHFPYVRLAISELDGGNARAITDEGAGAFNAAVSPDGRRIAYSRLDTARNIAVWIVDADGSNARQITHIAPADGRAQWPSWSADGRTLAVQVGKYDAQDHSKDQSYIWVIDVATGAGRQLGDHPKPYVDETPSWFPDGRRIAFQSNRTGRMEIWVMNADGSDARQITR